MEIVPEVGLRERFPDILRNEHQVVTVHPDCFQVFDLAADFNHFLCNFLVDSAVRAPVVVYKRAVVADVQEVVELGPDHTLVENQERLNLLERQEDWEALLVVKHLPGFSFLYLGKFVLRRDNSNPVKVELTLLA